MVESVFQNQGRQSSASEEYLVHVAQTVGMSRKHVAEFASEWPKSSFTSFLQKLSAKHRTSDCKKKQKFKCVIYVIYVIHIIKRKNIQSLLLIFFQVLRLKVLKNGMFP